MANQDFRLNDRVVRTQLNSIEYDSKSTRIAPKSMAVLECLAKARGAVVTRTELFDEVWPGQVVTEDVITHSIGEIRKALGDTARDPRFIETVPKKGFRLLVTVMVVDEDLGQASAQTVGWRRTAIVAAIVALSAISFWFWYEAPQAPSAAENSVAVLPFVDLSPNGDQEFFADGLTEELITRLTRIEGLQVSGRSSSFHFGNRDEDAQSVGRQLGVSHVLEGSVRRVGDELRVTVRLTDVDSGFHLWSTSYDRQLTHVFSIQEELAQAVAASLKVGLNVGASANIVGGTRNIDAFDAYLAGHAARQDGSPDSIIQAVRHYRRATELDSDFGLAFAMLAQASQEAFFYYSDTQPENYLEWRDEAIANALRAAPESLPVKAQLAQIEIYRGNLREARRLFDDVYARSRGGDVTYSLEYVDLLTKTGFVDRALVLTDRIQRWDPMRPRLAIYYGHLFVAQNRADEALAVLEQEYSGGRFLAFAADKGIVAALVADQPDEIRKWLTRAVDNLAPGFFTNNIHREMLQHFGDRERALEWLRAAYDNCPPCDFWIINWAAYLGDVELALKAMRRSRDLWAFWTPLMEDVRRQDTFKEIVIEAGLVDYWNEFGWSEFCRPTANDNFECR